MDSWHSASKCYGLVSAERTTGNGRQTCDLLWSSENRPKYRCAMPFTEQLGGQSCPYLHPRKWKLVCNSICKVLGCFLKLQKDEKNWRSRCICIKGLVVHEIVPSEKLGPKRIFDLEIRHNDWGSVKTIPERKDFNWTAGNSSRILFVDINWVFYDLKCRDYEWIGPTLPNWCTCILDWTKTVQYRPVTSTNNSRNVY